MPPKKPPITELRLKDPGAFPGNTRKTLQPAPGQKLAWHPQGVEVTRPDMTVLVPWGSIASVVSSTQREKTQQPTPETKLDIPARSSAGAARVYKTPRAAPSR